MSAVTKRLRRGGPPVNHDLQRAVRKAYLQATLAVCQALLKELGAAPSRWGRDLGVLFHPTDEIRWLDKVRSVIREELRRLPRADYVPPSMEADKQVGLLLKPKDTNGDQRKDELCAMLKQNLLEEPCQRHGEPPARFVEMVQHGWDDAALDGTIVHLDWFDLLCAFFVHDLKTNEKARTIFEGQLLAQLTLEGTPLTLAQSEELSERMVKRLEQLDAHIAQLRAEQAEGFAEVQDRLDEALPLLLYLPDIGSKQQRAIEMLQAILEILKPVPLPKPDYTAYLQRLRERLRELTACECALFRLGDFDPFTDALLLQLAEVKPDSPFGLLSRNGERGGVDEILAEHPRLVIVADGGAGKTTLARRWACALAERALADTTAPVPVYVEMNLYRQGKLRALIAASAKLDVDALPAELRAGRFVLIFDGLNEVATDAYADAVRELRTLVSHDDGNRVLVTARKHGYKDDLRLPTFAIEPLGESDIKAFVAARLGSEQDAGKGATLAKQLLTEARLRSLAENSMMLTMLTAIVGQAGDLPRNRWQLFKAFVDGVFAWEEQSLKTGATPLDRSIKESCLATIAYCLTEQGKVAAKKLTVGNWIADKLDELRLKKLDWTEVYSELLRNGLLVDSGREVRFFHEVWQDYFCACKLRKDIENLKSFFRAGWDAEVGLWKAKSFYSSIVLLAGIMDDAGPIVKQALEEDEWGYAFDCFAAAGFVNADVEQELFEVLPERWETIIRPQTKISINRGSGWHDMNYDDDLDSLLYPVYTLWPDKVVDLIGEILLRNPKDDVVWHAARSLGDFGSERAVESLSRKLHLVRWTNEYIADCIIDSLAALYSHGVHPALDVLLAAISPIEWARDILAFRRDIAWLADAVGRESGEDLARVVDHAQKVVEFLEQKMNEGGWVERLIPDERCYEEVKLEWKEWLDDWTSDEPSMVAQAIARLHWALLERMNSEEAVAGVVRPTIDATAAILRGLGLKKETEGAQAAEESEEE